jgi:hypothetical protein
MIIFGIVIAIYLAIGFCKVVANRIRSNAMAQTWGRSYSPPLLHSLRWMILWPKYL